MQGGKAGDHVCLGQGRHVRAHGKDAIGSPLPGLLEGAVVVRVKAFALVIDHGNGPGPLPRLGEQVLHNRNVAGRRGGDHQLVLVQHRLLPRSLSSLDCLLGLLLKVGHGGADALHHVEEHAAVQMGGGFRVEGSVLQHRQPGLHQTGNGNLAEQDQGVVAGAHLQTFLRRRAAPEGAAPCSCSMEASWNPSGRS